MYENEPTPPVFRTRGYKMGEDDNEGTGVILWGTVCGVFTIVLAIVLVLLAGGA